MNQSTFNFDDFIEVYRRGVSVKKLNPLKNQTYNILVKSNVDVRVVDRNNINDLLTESRCKRLRHMTVDSPTSSHRYFYVIPLQSPNGTYVGFIYRTLFDSCYNTVLRPFNDPMKKVPYMFGFYRDFDNYDRHTFSMPIVVCEGAKDAMVLKHFYPYVLANNTSRLGVNAQVLANITDKVLLAYDNDSTGQLSSKVDSRELAKLGCSADILKLDDGFKDIADYVERPQELRKLRDRFLKKIQGLKYGTIMSY